MNAVEKAPTPARKKMVEFSITRMNPDRKDTPSIESRARAQNQNHLQPVNHETGFSDAASEAIALDKPATKNQREQRLHDPSSRGVYQRKSGKWSTEFRSGKSRIWLGTFDTKEEATRAYLSKKMEIEASKLSGFSGGGGYGSKTVIESKKLSWSAKRVNVETFDDTVGSGDRAGEAPVKNWGLDDSSSRGVYQRKNGKWSTEFRSGKSRIWLGTFGTKEEARRAYLSKKMEVEGPEPSSRSTGGGGYGSKTVIGSKKLSWSAKRVNVETGEELAASSRSAQGFETSDDTVGSGDRAGEAPVKNWGLDDSSSRGVYQRKNGKWSTEFRSGKSRIWLGTFGTKEEARRAYLSKKMEVEGPEPSSRSTGGGGYGSKTVIGSKKLSWSAKRVNVETGEELAASSRSAQGFETSDDTVGSGDRAGEAPVKNWGLDDSSSRGVYQRKNGKWSTEFRSGKSRIWLGTFGTKEEARRAYLSKKMEVEGPEPSSRSTGGGGYGSKTVIGSKKLSWSAKRVNVETGEELAASSRSAQGFETSDDTVGSGDRAGEAPVKNCGLDDSSSRGVYQRKSGKWSTEFRSGKSRIWLGTFGTKEEARRAYLSKKMEVEGPEPSSRSTGGGYGWPEKPKGNNIQGTGEKPAASSCWVQAFGTSDQARVKSKTKSQRPYPGVFYRWGKWSAEVRNPFKKRKMWLGTFKSPEEAWAAIVGKKQEFDAMSLNLEKELFRHTDPSGGESNLATEDSTPSKGVREEPECSGESSEVTILKRFTDGIGRHDIDYIMKIASHIIDSYGNFLGEFSYVDDLQIR